MRPWSYSRLSTYEECPKQYWYSYVENMPGFREESPAKDRGRDIHAEAEAYLKGELTMYPSSLQRVAAHAMLLKSKKATSEQSLAVNDKWEPCEYDSTETYLRGIIDISFTQEVEDGEEVHVEDWKTGQAYNSHPIQMEMYVALMSAYHPKAVRYVTRLIYTDLGMVTPPKITEPIRIKPIRMMLDGRIANAEADEIFPVRVGSHCKWCEYSSRYGGPCPH